MKFHSTSSVKHGLAISKAGLGWVILPTPVKCEEPHWTGTLSHASFPWLVPFPGSTGSIALMIRDPKLKLKLYQSEKYWSLRYKILVMAVVSCAKICVNLIHHTWCSVKCLLQSIWIAIEGSLVKSALAFVGVKVLLWMAKVAAV